MAYSTAVQRQNLRAVRLCKAQPARMTRDGLKAAGGVRRPANRKEDSPRHASWRFLQKGSGRLRSAAPVGHSVLGPLSARPRRRRELRLVVTACWPALSSAPSSGATPLACAFKQGLCEYLFKSAFSAARARQSPRPARQTLRPASRYTDGRYRRPPPVCNCVSGSREPKRALTDQ